MTVSTDRRQHYWDDIREGDALEGYDLHVTETKIAEQVSGSQDFYPVHHDREFARAGGHADIFLNTGFTRAALSRLLTDFVGVDGWVRHLTYEMRRMNRPGDTLRLRGAVTRKYTSEEGAHLVDINLWIENDREGTATTASATVMLPARA
ncbi:MAG: MaoC/PaaZ C-terminal domain-containing protein [Dehalococcoidia bacterium]